MPDLADAGPKGQASAVSSGGSDRKAADVLPKQSRPTEKDGPGLKGFALSLDGDGGDQGLRIKTAFLVKPLKFNNFFVAFATAAPLLDTSTSNAGSLDLRQRRERPDAAPFMGPERQQDAATGWMVIGDLPRSSMLDAGNRDSRFDWMPELDGDSSWHSKVELIFLPADQWTVRAILSMAHDVPEDRQLKSFRDTHATRIGMGIDVDYQILKSMALGIDYDQYRYGNAFGPVQSEASTAQDGSEASGSIRGESIAARLTIRF